MDIWVERVVNRDDIPPPTAYAYLQDAEVGHALGHLPAGSQERYQQPSMGNHDYMPGARRMGGTTQRSDGPVLRGCHVLESRIRWGIGALPAIGKE